MKVADCDKQWFLQVCVIFSGIYPSRGSSLRDQLTMSGGAAVLASAGRDGVTASSGSGGSGGGGGGSSGGGGAGRDAPPRSLLGRLGIRKPSLLGLATPPEPAARTFSLDDLLRAPPGSKHPSFLQTRRL